MSEVSAQLKSRAGDRQKTLSRAERQPAAASRRETPFMASDSAAPDRRRGKTAPHETLRH